MRETMEDLSSTLSLNPKKPLQTVKSLQIARSVKADIVKGDRLHTFPYSAYYGRAHGGGGFYFGVDLLYFNKWTRSGYDAMAMVVPTGLSGTAFNTQSAVDLRKSTLNSANINLHDRLRDAMPEWDSLTDCAEMRETVALFRDMGRRVSDIIYGVASRNPKMVLRGFGIRQTKKAVHKCGRRLTRLGRGNPSYTVFDGASELWMGYRYGLMPTLYSIEDLMNVLGRGHWPPDTYQKIVGRARRKKVSSRVTQTRNSGNVPGTGDGFTLDTTITSELDVQVGLTAYVQFKDTLVNRILASPWVSARTAWELVPFSFVIDWFYPVGDWFSNLNLHHVIASNSWVCESVKGTRTDSYVGAVPQVVNPWRDRISSLQIVGDPVVSVTEVSFNRSRTGFTVPEPTLSWGVSTVKRAIDSLFLSLGKAKQSRHIRYNNR